MKRHWPKQGDPDSFKVKDFKQAARYLCHLDQADKHRYEIQDVQAIGAIDYVTLVMKEYCKTAAHDEKMVVRESWEAENRRKCSKKEKSDDPE